MPTATEQLTADIHTAITDYQPNETVQQMLQETTLVTVVGPVAIGKSTLMRTVEQYSDGMTAARSFTTRERRPQEAEDAYDFLPHNLDTLADILEDVQAGNLVQCAIHPANGRIYGTRPEAFTGRYAMLAPITSEIAGLRGLFPRLHVASVVAPPTDYQQRLAARFEATATAEWPKRIAEGIGSLAWSLSQTPETIGWVNNPHRQGFKAATALLDIAAGKELPDSTASHQTAQELFAFLQSLKTTVS